jgi:endonuclease/exonuclease/phosphatase family metal-dependent hydrolase
VTYNIGYASGDKNNRAASLSRPEVEKNLENIALALKQLRPDLLFLQEVDFGSARTFYIDQLQYLGQRLGLPYAAYVLTWNKNYVAWPYWPPQHHFGRLVSGQAVLSRFPIQSQEITVFDKPEGNPFWYNWFYLDRVAQTLELEVGEKTWMIYHVHLEAFDRQQTKIQLERVAGLIQEKPTPYKILAGDFNISWEGTGIPQAEALENRKQLEDFSAKTGLSLAGAQSPLLTFPSFRPELRIDHIYFSEAFRPRGTGNLTGFWGSDHLPVWAQLECFSCF